MVALCWDASGQAKHQAEGDGWCRMTGDGARGEAKWRLLAVPRFHTQP